MEIPVRISNRVLQAIYVNRNRLFLPQYYALGMINIVHNIPHITYESRNIFFISSYFLNKIFL